MIKVYKKESNVFHNVIYGILIFPTVAIFLHMEYTG